MGGMVQADIDALRALGQQLDGSATAIDGVQNTGTVTMPGSPIEALAAQINQAATDAYKSLAETVRSMASACRDNATTYEAADQAFADALKRYEAGSSGGG